MPTHGVPTLLYSAASIVLDFFPCGVNLSLTRILAFVLFYFKVNLPILFGVS